MGRNALHTHDITHTHNHFKEIKELTKGRHYQATNGISLYVAFAHIAMKQH